MLISQRKLERDSVNLDHGSEDLSGLAVSHNLTISLIIISHYLFTIDHAHPTMVMGHPFKGGAFVPFGMLMHPDMKLFGLNDSALFVPPRPDAFATAAGIGAGV